MKVPKIINRFAVISVLLICGSSSAFSQNKENDFKNKTPEERAKFQTEMMKSKLNLNAEQQSKIEGINLNYAKKFEPIIKSSDSKISRFKQAMSLQKAKDEELKKVFTASQYKQYEKFQEELKGKLKDKI
ncbi:MULTISPECIES: hypothetical protein [unclassified Pedobacter]|uniref:hypothetical protein n=1 Tax=unclassified Pedobacter TaxID=2628915 RepID=UPI0014239EAB|nr:MULTISPECIES: hypothetical protein [unclassified Pedobacter]NII83742.1 Fe2+ transport system protein B [Pedobacter sp. SG908]NMN37599.1 Fe2+ transport system protein B [Pedobacter sp. SG918]